MYTEKAIEGIVGVQEEATEGIVGFQEEATIVKVLYVYVAIHSFLITTRSLFLSCVKAGIIPVSSM